MQLTLKQQSQSKSGKTDMPKLDEWTQVIRDKSMTEIRKSLLTINLSNARQGLPHVNVIGEAKGGIVIGCVSLDVVKKAKEEICRKSL